MSDFRFYFRSLKQKRKTKLWFSLFSFVFFFGQIFKLEMNLVIRNLYSGH